MGIFEILFNFQSALGTFTVSLNTLAQSRWKIVSAAGWFSFYIYFTIHISLQLITSEGKFGVRNIVTILDILSVAFFIVRGVLEHKTLITTALNIQAARQKLVSMGIRIVPQKPINIFAVLILLIWKLTVMIGYWRISVFSRKDSLVAFLYSFHSTLALTSAEVLYLAFRLTISNITLSIRHALHRFYDNFQVNESNQVLTRPQICIDLETKSRAETILELKEIESVLRIDKAKVDNYFRFYLAWKLFSNALQTPIFLKEYLEYISGSGIVGIFSWMMMLVEKYAANIVFVHISEQDCSETYETQVAFANCSQNVTSKKRGQLLSATHRPGLTSGYIFSFEYSLVLETIDTSALVYTSIY